jgi:hypothetical protein
MKPCRFPSILPLLFMACCLIRHKDILCSVRVGYSQGTRPKRRLAFASRDTGRMTMEKRRSLHRTAFFRVFTQQVVVVPYRHFGTCRSHFQGHLADVSGQRDSPISKSQLKTEPAGCPETSVRNYLYSLRNNHEECSSHLLGGGSLQSREVCTAWHSTAALICLLMVHILTLLEWSFPAVITLD